MPTDRPDPPLRLPKSWPDHAPRHVGETCGRAGPVSLPAVPCTLSLRRVAALYRRHLNEKRPHQGIGNRIPCHVRTGQTEHTGSVGAVGKVECEEFLGGLLRSYQRAAA